MCESVGGCNFEAPMPTNVYCRFVWVCVCERINFLYAASLPLPTHTCSFGLGRGVSLVVLGECEDGIFFVILVYFSKCICRVQDARVRWNRKSKISRCKL